MTRTSPAEVRGLFRRVVEAAERAGIDTTGWTLVEGGSGEVWHVRRVVPFAPASDVFVLGVATREAALTLSGMARALELVPAREEHR